jgi:predicted metal-dependent HD superfamily phosphohydrolase
VGPELLLDLTRRYCEPHRHYHTILHIAHMLRLGRDLDLSDEQVLAIWFHDAIYDVRSTTNEQDSAALAVDMLRQRGYTEASIEIVRQIVLDTEEHLPSIPEAEVVVDLDLSSLAADPAIFDRNGVVIRKEYAWIPEEQYRLNLRGFLEKFLAKDQIFWTAWGKRLESRARANLQRALAEL